MSERLQPPSEAAETTKTYLEQVWRRWVRALFPGHVSDEDGDFVPFAPQHERFWKHVWSIKRGVKPRPYLLALPRGQAKSTSMEMACVAIGARRIRPYALYLCGLQDQADDHVANIKDMIANSAEIARLYPELSDRAVSRYGHSEGWNRNRLSTASGFTVDAIGLDTARARGKKFKINRPGIIFLDDLDDQSDSPDAVEKKIQALKSRILPTGAEDLAVIGGQNMVHPNSIFSRLFSLGPENTEPDFLTDRILDGPVPAIEDLEYEQRAPGEPGGFEDRVRFVITAGRATWEGMDLGRCQEIIDTEGISAFLSERQHQVEAPPGGMFDHLEYVRCSWDEVPWHAIERTVVWVDPAVTNTDASDSHAIQASALGAGGTIYRLFSWENRTSPTDALRRAILKAVELGAEHVGVETDQGGDTWESVYREAAGALVSEGILAKRRIPRFASAKAGSVQGSKTHRASLMLSDYERGRIVHVKGTHRVLEAALRRFPKTKPLDLADASYWSWDDLRNGTKKGSSRDLMSESALGTISGTVF